MTDAVLYAADTTPLEDPALYSEAYSLVTTERQAKTDRLRFERDRRLSLSAELLLRYALTEAGVPFPMSFGAGPAGKPELPCGTGLSFSLSHSGSMALCALSPLDVGCDIEKTADADLKIAKRCFSPSEREYVLSPADEAERRRRFFRLWTLKESFMKATGLGMKLPLGAFSVSVEEDGRISVSQSVDGRSYFFSEFDSLPGYACAVCIAGDRAEARLDVLDIRKILPPLQSSREAGEGLYPLWRKISKNF